MTNTNKKELYNLDGILLLDKPTGISSNDALQRAKRLFSARKAGHTGSLDPLASGLLPICFGEATKFSQYLLDANKRYHTVAKLGIKTTTGDAEGEIVTEKTPPTLTLTQLDQVLEKFRGPILQTPSMYSALKHNGKPLYELARQGIEIEREARAITIYDLNLLELTSDTFSLDVICSKGTYIRSLVEDIGDALGCGAHVTELRRLMVGPYQAEQMITLAQLEEILEYQGPTALNRHLLPLDSMLSHWPIVQLTEPASRYLCRGLPVLIPNLPHRIHWVRIIDHEGKFLGIGEKDENGKIAPRRLIVME